MDVTAFVGKILKEDDADVLKEGVQVLSQALMEAEVSAQIGALPYERSAGRTAYRNGYRTRAWDTRVGTIELKIPKITSGSYFPSLLEPRRRAERALHAVVIEAYVKGVSTRKVDDLVKALGIDGISRSEVSRICKTLDGEVAAFRSRTIEGGVPLCDPGCDLPQGQRARPSGLGGLRRGGRRHVSRRATRTGSRQRPQ
jgi:transposase-like protein